MSDNELRRGPQGTVDLQPLADTGIDLADPVPAADSSAVRLAPPEGQDAGQVTLGEPSAEAGAKQGLNGHRPSGRVRHDEKITVYVSGEELIALERARLDMRGDLGLSVDRGRIVRAAVAMALDDLNQHGSDSQLVQRLRTR